MNGVTWDCRNLVCSTEFQPFCSSIRKKSLVQGLFTAMAEQGEIPKEETPSTSGGAQGETKKVKELFDMKNCPHWLDTDEEDYDDFDETDREKDPEYFLTDEQVEEAFKEMDESEKKLFLELKTYHKVDYRQKGDIRPLSTYVQDIVKWLKPGIPSKTHEVQEMLRTKLLAKARTKSELRERGELPEEKPKVRRIRPVFQGPATTETKQEDGTIVITVIPGRDPYEDLDHEEDMIVDLTGMESMSEEEPDEELADDLSIVTIDSMTSIDKDKVKKLWKEMSETKAKEAEVYSQLSDMVEDMTPAVIQETIVKTPKPGTNIPAPIEEFYEELGNATKFKRIVALGFMVYEEYLNHKDPTYKPLSLRKVLKKFKTDSKGMLEVRKAEEQQREERKRKRLLKTELKPKMELKQEKVEKEEKVRKETVEIPGMDEEMAATEGDLYDPAVFSAEESGPEADLGTEEDEADGVDPSGTSSELPGYTKGGSKRKREEAE